MGRITMRPTLRGLGGVAFVLFALVAIAACGGGENETVATAGQSGDDAVATADQSEATDDTEANPGPGEPPSDDPEERMLQYAQCLRDQGIDIGDPGPGGEWDHGAADHRPDELDEAAAACRAYASGGVLDHGVTPEYTEEMLAYISCLRDEGVDIADPDPETGMPHREDMQKFWNPDRQMQQAMQACEDQRPGVLQGGGH